MAGSKLTERQIQVFRTVMVTGSISAAARQLYVSQPGVSVTIKRFEDLLGTPLFERIGGRMAPTDEARQIFDKIERVHTRFEQLVDAITGIVKGEGITFRFGTTPSVGVRLVPKALRKLREDNPDRLYYCDFLSQKDIRDYLWFDRGACVASIAKIDDPALAHTVVATGRLVCLLQANHRLARKREISPRDLSEETLISFEPGMTHGRLIESAYEKAGVVRKTHIFVRSVESAISFVVEGLGVAIVDEFAAIGCHQLGLVAVSLKQSADIPVYVYWSKLHPRVRSVEEFVAALTACAKAEKRHA